METTTINALSVQKELMKFKVEADFSHYTSGNLYYTVGLSESVTMGTYQFPIPTVEQVTEEETMPYTENTMPVDRLILSQDLGTTTFSKRMKGSELNRWIKKAIEKGDFVRVA